MKKLLVLTSMMVVPAVASGQPHPWPFDFDSQVSPHHAYIDQRIAEFTTGLPELPATAMTEVTVGEVRLYFHPQMAEAFFRARDSGPGFAELLARDPQLCQVHGSFDLPDLTPQTGLPSCIQAKALIEAVFVDHRTTCLQVEFPEIYVLEYEAGPIPPSTLTSFEGLISLCGEALMHVDFQENLFHPDLLTTTREVIAKLREGPLLAAIAQQRQAYQEALDALAGAAGCFDPADVTALTDGVGALTSELDAAEQWLTDLVADGLAQAAADLAAIQAQGRARDELLHPSLTDDERLMLSFYIGGIYWRMRGAGLVAEPPDPGQGLLRRLYFVQYPFQLIGELNGGMTDAENVGFNVFVQENWGYADWMDMGNSPGLDNYADLVDMTDRGREATLLVAPLLSQRGYDTRDLVFGGLMMGPCYFYAWEELRFYQLGPDLQYPYMWFLEIPTATGEFCTGGTLALGLAHTLLWGKPGAACEPDCIGKECGDDGCGLSCGDCAPGEACTQGTCQACTVDCAGKECGDDGCGGSCGQCAQHQVCQQGLCVCAPDCAGVMCGDDGCGGSCGQCIGNDVCQGGQCVCTPSCAARECGDDGCGGSCGSCDPGSVCEGGVCAQCTPDCVGKECGGDGCGGECGTCDPGLSCQAGICEQCALDCAGKVCGGDGCGGVCGTCEPGESCVAGLCEPCSPDCTDATCGDDGCGGSCGTCPAEQGCQVGACVDDNACPGGDCDKPEGCSCGAPGGRPGCLLGIGLLVGLAMLARRRRW